MNKKIILFLASITAVLFIVLFFYQPKKEALAKVCFPSKCIAAEIADTQEKRSKGLMFRESISDDEGMLFIFDSPGKYTFWMKNTFIPLDIIWISSDLQIVEMQTALPCEADPCAVYGGNFNSKYIVELNAGFAEKNKIKTGDFITINLEEPY